jgi:hypothetical protein
VVDWFIRYGKARGGVSVMNREINGWKRMREEEKGRSGRVE